MKLRFIWVLPLLIGIFAACQDTPRPVEYYIEVTREVTVIVTADSQTGSVLVSGTSTPIPTEATTEVTATLAVPTVETTPPPTATPDAFPPPETGQFTVAEQVFEHGNLFWLEPIDQIWVISTNAEGNQVWEIYEDTFEDGMLEVDEDLQPPISGLYQPVRGFGQLWRENSSVQEQLGWALAEEVGYTTNYQYHYGGTVSADNVFTQGPGYHLVQSISGDMYRFNEGIWTWEIVNDDE